MEDKFQMYIFETQMHLIDKPDNVYEVAEFKFYLRNQLLEIFIYLQPDYDWLDVRNFLLNLQTLDEAGQKVILVRQMLMFGKKDDCDYEKFRYFLKSQLWERVKLLDHKSE